MTEEEKASIFSAPEFLDFVEHSTKIIQRALNDSYDYVRDYTLGTETGPCVVLDRVLNSLLNGVLLGTTQRAAALNASARSTMNVTERIDQ